MEHRILAAKLLVVFTLITVLASCSVFLTVNSSEAIDTSSETLETRVAQLEQTVGEQQAVINRITGFMVDLSNDYVLLERRVGVLEYVE